MSSIYQIQDKYKLIQSLIEDGADPEIFISALNEIDGELSEKLENYASIIKNIESDIAGIKLEEQRLNERRKSMENKIKGMKFAMQEAMLISGEKRIKGKKFNFTVQNNPPSLNILDENLIPRNFVTAKTELVIDKKAILADLKNGQVIEGVEIKQAESLRIR